MLNKKESTKEFNRVKKLIEQRDTWYRKYEEAKEKAIVTARKKSMTKHGRTLKRRKLEAEEMQRLVQKEDKSKKTAPARGFLDGVSPLDEFDKDDEEQLEQPRRDKDPETISRSSSMVEKPLYSVLLKQSQAMVNDDDNRTDEEEEEADLNLSFGALDGGDIDDDDMPSVSDLVRKAERQRSKAFGAKPRVMDVVSSQEDRTLNASTLGKPVKSKSYVKADVLYYMKQMCKLQGQSIEIETLRNAQTTRTFAVSSIVFHFFQFRRKWEPF